MKSENLKHAELLVEMKQTVNLDLAFDLGGESFVEYPKAWIVIKSSTESPDGLTALSAQSASYEELRWNVDRLIEELEVIKQRAKRLFDAAEKKRA